MNEKTALSNEFFVIFLEPLLLVFFRLPKSSSGKRGSGFASKFDVELKTKKKNDVSRANEKAKLTEKSNQHESVVEEVDVHRSTRVVNTLTMNNEKTTMKKKTRSIGIDVLLNPQFIQMDIKQRKTKINRFICFDDQPIVK